jgi:hypothetical protein
MKGAEGVVDVISIKVHNYIISWWIIQTKVSQNKKDVTRLKVGPNRYEMKPTHYLMETQVLGSFFSKFCSLKITS